MSTRPSALPSESQTTQLVVLHKSRRQQGTQQYPWNLGTKVTLGDGEALGIKLELAVSKASTLPLYPLCFLRMFLFFCFARCGNAPGLPLALSSRKNSGMLGEHVGCQRKIFLMFRNSARKYGSLIIIRTAQRAGQ